MAGLTYDVAQARLSEYLAAEAAVLSNQAYTIAGRSLTRANLREIREGVEYWDRVVNRLARGGISIRLGVPR